MAPGTLIGEILPQAVGQTGLPHGTRIYAGGGDGQCAALGVNALGKGRVYLNLGGVIQKTNTNPNLLSLSFKTSLLNNR